MKGKFGNAPRPCACGCGQLTELDGYGRARKFSTGHMNRGDTNPSWKGGSTRLSIGYVGIRDQDHPRAIAGGYVLAHVLMAEHALRHPLPEGAPVHHVNGTVNDNRPGNLVICQDQAYHMLLHQRQRALKACGNANWRKCSICKQYDDPSALVLRRDGKKTKANHRACLRHYDRISAGKRRANVSEA